MKSELSNLKSHLLDLIEELSDTEAAQINGGTSGNFYPGLFIYPFPSSDSWNEFIETRSTYERRLKEESNTKTIDKSKKYSLYES